MYRWWIKLNDQAVPVENSSVLNEVLQWGAKLAATASLTDMEIPFISKKNPTRLINKLKAQGDIEDGKVLSESQLAKPRRNPTRTPGDKAKSFADSKKRFGIPFGGKP